ncbi:hypothetical protein [Ferrimonas pelagia]|uniref:Lysozyme n=1 Tax=Ferrimonas pelagia TaxID=1177826 RepID=A0ABP9EMR4_9GAMM
MMMNHEATKQIMDAMFTQQRLQVLSLGVHHNEYTDAYLYAWEKSVYPLMQDSDDSVAPMPHQHYTKQFIVSESKVNEIYQYLEQCWLDNAVPTYYELENEFRFRITGFGWGRMDLVHICRYLHLNGSFDGEFWKKLLTPGKHPSELGSTSRQFDRKREILFQY